MRTVKFKSSEVGPIPVEWEVKRLGELWDSFRTGPFGSALHAQDYIVGGTPLINPMHIQDGRINPTSDMSVDVETEERLSAYRLSQGDIIIGRRGEMGRAAIVGEKESGWLCGTGCFFLRMKGSMSPDYVTRYLRTPTCVSVLEGEAVGTTLVNLNQTILGRVNIPIPPHPEQEKIAEALSDVDALLSAMTTLIEKKRAIKQGAMQQLLTGKKRLAGFTGPWVKKRLGDCSTIARGGSPRPIDAYLTTREDGLNWVKIGDVGIDSKYIEHTAEKILPSGLTSTRMVYPGDFLLSNSMSFGRPYIMKITGCIHDGWLVIQDYKAAFDSEYLYYALGSELVVTQYKVFAAGSSVLNLNKDVVADVTLTVPPTVLEQQSIAAVLSDMDAEIAALEAKRAKYESIKQGMMQELLTGRVRLGAGSTERA